MSVCVAVIKLSFYGCLNLGFQFVCQLIILLLACHDHIVSKQIILEKPVPHRTQPQNRHIPFICSVNYFGNPLRFFIANRCEVVTGSIDLNPQLLFGQVEVTVVARCKFVLHSDVTKA